MIVAMMEGKLSRAESGARGQCPECRNEVYARMPDNAIRHWAHKPLATGEVRDCSLDAGEMTEWHRVWQSLREDPECIEVRRDDHRADVINPGGFTIEFQHSSIAPEEIEAREKFWRRGLWVVDGTPSDDGEARVKVGRKPDQSPEDPWRSFKWPRAPLLLYRAKWPIWIDLAGRMLQIHHTRDNSGNGWLLDTGWFIKEVLNGQRPTFKEHKPPVTDGPEKRIGRARRESEADLHALVESCDRTAPEAAPRLILDWSSHKIGDPRPCRLCRRPSMMRDEAGLACHKTCAESEQVAAIQGGATSLKGLT